MLACMLFQDYEKLFPKANEQKTQGINQFTVPTDP